MAYFIAVYDIGERRVGKMLKLFRRYLTWVQNSVFEGDLSEAQYLELRSRAEHLMEPEDDSIIFYRLRDERYSDRQELGLVKARRDRFI